MTFIPHTPEQRAQMLKAIGVARFEDLLTVPPKLRLTRPLALPPAHGEVEMAQAAQRVLSETQAIPLNRVFAGGGAYPHHVPAVVDELSHRGEFYTAYTPYQPEVSQGMLHCIYEYQSYICLLTGMEVSNASGYDLGTVLADAVLMAMYHHKSKRRKVVFTPWVNPMAVEVVATYNIGAGLTLVHAAPGEHGFTCQGKLKELVDGDTAAVVFQYPNYLGYLEDKLAEQIALAHAAGALAIVVFYPFAAGLLKTPGELGADIVCGEAQCLGNPLGFGGPLLGYLACLEKYVRVMPGRLIGRTLCERDGAPGEGFVMTLQAREQHIRRDKATSNICSNEALLALRTCIYMGAVGKQGFDQIAAACHGNALRAHEALTAIAGVEDFFPARQFFNEFTLRFPAGKRDAIYNLGLSRGILAGFKPDAAGTGGYQTPGLEHALTFAFTEVHHEADIAALAQTVQEVLK